MFLTEENRKSIAAELKREKGKISHNHEIAEALNKLKHRRDAVAALLKKIYEDFSFGNVDGVVYKKLSAEYAAEYNSLERSIAETKKNLQSAEQNNSRDDFLALLKEAAETDSLSEPLLKMLIERIEIEQGYYEKMPGGRRIKLQHIKIYYNFTDS